MFRVRKSVKNVLEKKKVLMLTVYFICLYFFKERSFCRKVVKFFCSVGSAYTSYVCRFKSTYYKMGTKRIRNLTS